MATGLSPPTVLVVVVLLLLSLTLKKWCWAVAETTQALRRPPTHGRGDERRYAGSQTIVGYDELLESSAVSCKTGSKSSASFWS